MEISAPQFDWSGFCDVEYEVMETPFVKNGWKCATDGRIAIRVKTDEQDTPRPEGRRRDFPNVAGAFELAAMKHQTAILLPDITECPECQGKFLSEAVVQCDECGGTGETECFHCGHDMDCEECDGSGKVTDEVECETCTARYKVALSEKISLAPRYVLLLLRHGIRSVAHSGDPDVGATFQIHINGQIGEGLLMPLTRD